MGTFTAHLAIGNQNEGGMIPFHEAWLWENGRPVWMLEPTRLRLTGDQSMDDRPGSKELIRWFPEQPGSILEDGLLLLAIHSFSDEQMLMAVREAAPQLMELSELQGDPESPESDPELSCDLGQISHKYPHVAKNLPRLRELCKRVDWPKLVVTALEGSSIERQMPVLERYPMQLEVCTVTYSRLVPEGAWGPIDPGQPPRIRGSLKPRPDAPGDRYTEVRI